MKIIADTNVLVRIIMNDNEVQAKTARKFLNNADLIAVTTTSLCELVWVLSRTYRLRGDRIAVAIRALLNTGNVAVNRTAVEAGLALLDAGGDFADGVIAHEGAWLDGEIFVSFDKKTGTLLSKQEIPVRIL
jgi:predicted nucleic-acid-binding protein